MVFTGGTISMKIVPGRGAVPARSGREILDQVPQLLSLAAITCEDFDRLPGPHWSPEDVFELARHVDERLLAADLQAVSSRMGPTPSRRRPTSSIWCCGPTVQSS
jgi:L-asparaginase